MGTKYVIYRRLSKEDKNKTQHGFESQMNDIQYFLNNENNSEIIGDFKEFISGTAEHKPNLEKAVAMCKETNATLLVAKIDRLSRRVSQIAKHMESNVSFKVASLPNADNFQLHIYAALSEQERAMISDRVVRGLRAAKQKGVKLGAASPSYNKTKHISKKIRQDSTEYWEKQRSNIEGAIGMMKKNKVKMTYDNICDNLKTFGITSREGKLLTPSQTRRIMEKLNISRI